MRKLPAFAAFGHASRSTTDNIGFAFHISWPWVLMLLPFRVNWVATILGVTLLTSLYGYSVESREF